MADFNDPDKLGRGQEMVDRLSNLVAIFENPALDFSKNRAEGDDLLGNAYEYLMRNFATESGRWQASGKVASRKGWAVLQQLPLRGATGRNARRGNTSFGEIHGERGI